MNIFFGINHKILRDINLNRVYNGIEYDSRKIKDNFIFVALEGTAVDGHNFIDKAVENGATCIICSKEIEMKHNISYVLVEDLRKHLGFIASNFYNWPQKKLKLIGVTGTNGKTSSTYMIEKLLDEPITRIGTIEYKIGDEVFEAVNTTPESLDLVKIFYQTLKKGINYVIMEVSSHSLELGRVAMLDFDYAMFTNLTQDHLDYHKNIENYFQAKRKLFLKLKDKNNAVINIDDEYGLRLYKEFLKENNEMISYSLLKNSKLFARHLEDDIVEISYQDKIYTSKYFLLGNFNLYNVLGSIGIALKLGISIEKIVEKISTLIAAPGRFENVYCGQDFKVIVDYAHTPDALKNVITVAKDIKNRNRVITIFGCGGDRDKTKRPIMADISEKLSDITILTSDNPRTEDNNQIIADVIKGFKTPEKHIIEPNREEAIKKAIHIAKSNDIILITGKGHETYHIIGTMKMHFDDKEIARREIVRKRSEDIC